MKTAKTTAATAASRQTPADRAYLAQGRQFLATLNATAKKAGVPLNEFLLRAAFEEERTSKRPEVSNAQAPFIRAVARREENRGWEWAGAVVGHMTCDMTLPNEDGGPSRYFPSAFEFAPETAIKEDARWLSYEDFCAVQALPCWECDVSGDTHCHLIREHEDGVFTVRLAGTDNNSRFAFQWAPLSVACWFFGLSDGFLEEHIAAGRLAASTHQERLVSLNDVSLLLEILSRPNVTRNIQGRSVPANVRGLHDITASAFQWLRSQRERMMDGIVRRLDALEAVAQPA